ncbi:MAG: carbohydrate ABC transporter permease [Clostridia bacterium]|nr:carbohydrate ABC transporter permease [Clostridia bacterium]
MENIANGAPTLTRWERFKSKYFTKHFASKFLTNLLLYLLLFGLAYVVLFPLIMRVSNAVKGYEDVYNANVYIIPQNFTLQYVKEALVRVDLLGKTGWFALWYSALISILQVASATLAGYGFARFKFPGNKLLFACVLFVLIVPPTTITTTLYEFFLDVDPWGMVTASGERMSGWNLCATVIPQSLMAIGCVGYKNGLYIYLMRQYFKGMPGVLEEAAYIDGAKPFKAFFRVMLPSAFTMMVTCFLFGFCWQWTDDIYTTTIAIDLPSLMTKALNYNNGSSDALWNSIQQQTGVLIAVIPLILLFIVCQRFFVEGIERSGITGT